MKGNDALELSAMRNNGRPTNGKLSFLRLIYVQKRNILTLFGKAMEHVEPFVVTSKSHTEKLGLCTSFFINLEN